jgi:uncharacterized protein YceK
MAWFSLFNVHLCPVSTILLAGCTSVCSVLTAAAAGHAPALAGA